MSAPTPSGRGRAERRAAVGRLTGCLLVMALTGCAGLGLGTRQGDGDAREAADRDTATADTAARADSDAVAAADSGASLRDSVLAEMKARRAAGDTAADGDGAGGQEKGQGPGNEVAGGDDRPSGPVRVTDLDSLKSLGPVYTPYDVPPLLQKQGVEPLLRATILPVIRRYELEPDEWARFWVLVDREGRVVDHVLQLTSGHAAFDGAAAAAAERLRYRPARRDDERVPVWVLVRISLLMG